MYKHSSPTRPLSNPSLVKTLAETRPSCQTSHHGVRDLGDPRIPRSGTMGRAAVLLAESPAGQSTRRAVVGVSARLKGMEGHLKFLYQMPESCACWAPYCSLLALNHPRCQAAPTQARGRGAAATHGLPPLPSFPEASARNFPRRT